MTNKNHISSRRTLLMQSAGIAGVAAIAGLVTAKPAKADGGTMSPASVGYVDKPNGSHQCSNCALFIPGTPATGNGLCKAVAGPISPTAWCQIWSPAA
jgi:hypothetical protein